MANATVSIYLDSSYTKKDGTSRFYIRLTLNRKSKKIPLNLFINPDYYNARTKKIKEIKEVPNAKGNNLYLKEKESDVQQIIIELERRKQPVTFTNVLNLYDNKEANGSFIEYARARLITERNILKPSTYKGLLWDIEKVERYFPNVTIYEIDVEWLENYRNILIEKLGNKLNTIYGNLSMIRKYVTLAYKKTIIKTNPFHNFPLEKEDGKKEHLTLEELDILHKYYNEKLFLDVTAHDDRGKTYLTGLKYQETLQHILISCYTGLRLADLQALRYKHIENGMIIMPMGKSRKNKEKTLRIPITTRLKAVLDLNEGMKPDDKVYQGFVRNSSEINPMLRHIMKEIGINKYLTFHSTRHTFAVSALTLGMSIETVSDIMGHNDLKTTQIYAKVVDDKRIGEMSKWNKMSKLDGRNDCFDQVVCPECNNPVLTFEKGVIKLKKLTLECQFCTTNFSYKVN
ncbi:MAG: site-specific integrase [Bacteroidales bacterium]|jgi:integrase|nr:site-specific integrase [Bacteroidales bacterium]